jgi:endonuclease III
MWMMRKFPFDAFFRKYRNFRYLSHAYAEEVKQLIRPLGIGNGRTKIIKSLADFVIDNYNDTLPVNKADLLKLPGVEIYSANAVLCLFRSYVKLIIVIMFV